MKINLCRAGAVPAAIFLATAWAVAGGDGRSVFVLTSTNNASGNAVVVFTLNTGGTPSLSFAESLPTGGNGGASTNAGILQFQNNLGAVANYGSNSVSRLVRYGNFIGIGGTINLVDGCMKPDSVALAGDQLFVVGANCAESHTWPSGYVDGTVVGLADPSAAQIAVGQTWAAVTQSDGYLLQLPLTPFGALSGTSTSIPLQADADSVPLGEAFWGDILGFTPAHSEENFAIVSNGVEYPIPGTPFSSGQAPCWVAKGAGNIWYTGNSPGHAVSIFFSDSQGGVFYKSIPLGGAPSDITVSPDGKWLAVIYVAGGEGYISVFSIDAYGDLTYQATSPSVGVPGFSGVAFSE
ncbi:MAG TPA: hypothetical protein VEN79_02345 [Terriglobia bacterium]|nr:hypothetical protein [Terriglobia bacterium]